MYDINKVEQDKNSEAATFSIVNNSNASSVCYDIYLDDNDLLSDEVRVEDKFVKYSLDSAQIIEQVDYHADLYREKITSVITKIDINIPETAITVTNGNGNYWDISEDQDGSIIAYIEDDGTGNETYKLTMGQVSGLMANSNSNKLFYKLTNVKSMDLTYLNTSKTVIMKNMFNRCNSLLDLEISNFDTSLVTDMSLMFFECNNLNNLDLSGFNTSLVTDMSYMFNNCTNLSNISIRNFDTINVTKMNHMFYGCSSLQSLDVSTFNTSNVTNMSSMFENCTSLTVILAGDKWEVENATINNMFNTCGTDRVVFFV